MSVKDDVTCVRDIDDLDLICMLTFLLSINNCLTKSLAKHSQIDFQREFAFYHLKCFPQKLVFGGGNRRWYECHTKKTLCPHQRPQLQMSGMSNFDGVMWWKG